MLLVPFPSHPRDDKCACQPIHTHRFPRGRSNWQSAITMLTVYFCAMCVSSDDFQPEK